ncbi:hypothetical protein QCA50_008654 [Cerrena zonata]|uniref:Uncharacterized protein n=1 Tax=Cerrena zonata TaxID=2478898 RepID=A0AAW0GE32_9APHY
MSLTLQTEKNVPLTQGATAKGRVASSPDEVKLWIAAFVLREAVLIALEEMTDSEARYYFNGLYEYVKSVWMSTQTRVLGSKGAVPYLLSSFSSIRKPQGKASGTYLKHDFLRMFYWSEENSVFHGVPAIPDDLEWPGAHELQPIWCERVKSMNGWRAKREEPPMYLCLTSALFNMHPCSTHLSDIFHVQYQALSPPTTSREKRPRAATDDELAVHASGSGSGSPAHGSVPSTSSQPQSSGPIKSIEPPLKRIRTADEGADDVEMTDVSGGGVLASTSEAQVDRKGKGRARDPVLEVTSTETPQIVVAESENDSQDMDLDTEDVDLTEFMDQDVMFPAALEEQLSPVPCKSCAHGGHDCYVALKHFHGCWRCKASSNGCSLVPKGEQSAKGELKNMKRPQHWPWYITLVFHVLNVLALDTEAGPQYLPSEYTDVELPDFPTEKVTHVMAPFTTNQIKEMAREKKTLKADVYYALPRSLAKELESKRKNSPLWPMVPKDAESRFEDIIRRANLGTLTRSWAAKEVPERGRARSRVSAPTTSANPPQQRGRSTRALSKVSSRGSEVPLMRTEASEGHSLATKASGSAAPTSKGDTHDQTPSRPRPKPRAASKARATSRPPPKPEATPVQVKKTTVPKATSSKLVKRPSKPRATAVRSRSVKINQQKARDEDSSPTPQPSRRRYIGKRPPPVMKRVPADTDEDEETLTAYGRKRGPPREKFLVATVQSDGELEIETLVPTTPPRSPDAAISEPNDPYVTTDILSAKLDAQKDTFLEALKEAEGSLKSGVQDMISLAMDDLHPQLSSNVQKFVTGIHRELDHRLSGYMHGIERHLDSKIDEKVNSLTKSLEQKMDDLLAKHHMETWEMMKEIFGDEVKEVLRNDEKDGGSAKEDKRDNETETPVSNQANQDFKDPTYPELSPEVPLVPATGGDGSSLEIDTSRQPAEVVHVSGPNEVDQPSSPSTPKIPDAPQNTVPSPAIEPDQFLVSVDVDMPLAESTNASTTDEHGSHQIRNEVSGKCIFCQLIAYS